MDHSGQEIIEFDFHDQDPGRQDWTQDQIWGKQVLTLQGGCNGFVKGDPDISGLRQIGFPGVLNDSRRPQQLDLAQAVKLAAEHFIPLEQEIIIVLQDPVIVRATQARAGLGRQVIVFGFAFQLDDSIVVLIGPDAEFLPEPHPVDFFPLGSVVKIIKIEARYDITVIPVHVFIRTEDRMQPCAQPMIGLLGQEKFVFMAQRPSLMVHGLLSTQLDLAHAIVNFTLF